MYEYDAIFLSTMYNTFVYVNHKNVYGCTVYVQNDEREEGSISLSNCEL